MLCQRARPRVGITRTEVVVILVLAVAGAGLGVVAMRQWWENSARVSCMEHLEKIGKGIRIHQDQLKHLPASRLAKGYATWAVQVAPYLPEIDTSALEPWDPTKTYYAQSEAVRKAQVAYFYCGA